MSNLQNQIYNFENQIRFPLKRYQQLVFMNNTNTGAKRELFFSITNKKQVNAIAYHEYDSSHVVVGDIIELWEGLFVEIYNLITNNFDDDYRVKHMLSQAYTFLSFHELAHLYGGHCQLSRSKSMTALPSDVETGFTQADELVMEISADVFAARRTTEKVLNLIINGSYNDFGYPDVESYCYDALIGIHSVFWIMYTFALKSGAYILNPLKNETHPETLNRCYYSSFAFIEQIKKVGMVNLKIDENSVVNLIMNHEEIFGGFSLTPELKQVKYKLLTSGAVGLAIKNANQHYESSLKARLKPFSWLQNEI